MYGALRYRLETSYMDSSWKNSDAIFFVFPELSPLVNLRPFDKQRYKIFVNVVSRKGLKLETLNLCQLIGDDE